MAFSAGAGRLDEHAHLVVVVVAVDRDAVHTGADHGARDPTEAQLEARYRFDRTRLLQELIEG
jgi:hypothetical protein